MSFLIQGRRNAGLRCLMLLSKPVETGGWRIAYLSPNMPGVRVPPRNFDSVLLLRPRNRAVTLAAPVCSVVSSGVVFITRAATSDNTSSWRCVLHVSTFGLASLGEAANAVQGVPSEQLLVPVATPALCTARSRASWYFIPPPYIGGEPVTGGTQNARHAPA
ncbi:hypothetical protein B0H14DRAFT_3518535 [Mycena olivaceomarginata]|nr:hypothetical protein B0H14DRAFT_3518535 [Mycena olivaceomarginata]